MKRVLAGLLGAAVVVPALVACGSRTITVNVEPSGLPSGQASAAPAPSYTVSCKMAKGPGGSFSGPDGSWNPVVTVKNTSSEPMQLPNLNIVNQPLGFDFEFFSASGAQAGTPSDGISPDQSGIITIQPGQSQVFTFTGDVDQSEDTVPVATCTALITGYSDAY